VSPSTQHAEVYGRNNVIVQIQGDGNTVVAGLAHLTLTRYLNRRRGGGGPTGEAAEILSPYALAIPFIGREPVMADLRTWMEKDQPISVRVLTARGGGGKTRLALELCDEATRRGWFAGFVTDRELLRFLAQQNLSTWGWSRPTLVVLDYAASRARLLHEWLVELADNAGGSGHPLRLLLLERHADPSMGWWLEAFGRGGGDADAVRRLLDPAGGPFILPAVGASERRVIFGAALEQVGGGLQPPETPDFARRLAELSWGGEPLFLIMAGLTAARAGLAHVLALSPTDVVFEVAKHELHRIREIGKHRGIDGGFLAHMAAYVTLCQGLSRSQAEEAIAEEKRALRYDSGGDPPRVYDALYDALPGEGTSVAPILPDLLGEAVTVLALGDGNSQNAEEAVARAAARGGDRVVSAVVRTADDFGSVREEVLGWLKRLVKEEGENDESAAWIVAQLPQESLALRETAAELAAALVDRFRRGDRKDQLAKWLASLAVRLSAVGRREDALKAGQEAVDLYRELALWRPEAFSDLAVALNNLGILQSAVGRQEEALEVAQEAVSIRRELVSSDPEIRPFLADSLMNLANRLSDMGRWGEALESSQEAAFLYRELALSSPEAFLPGLAKSFVILANQLSATGRREKALEVGQEAVSLYRELASSRPAFHPDLAKSLNNLSTFLSAVGRKTEALEAVREAVSLYHGLASSHPEAFHPDLAMSLTNLALWLSAAGRHEEALEAVQEAVSIRRELVSSRPGAFRSDLAISLTNLAGVLRALGRQVQAMEACQEAVSIRRELAASRPEAFRPGLANSLNTLSVLLSDAGKEDQAVEASREALELLTPLFLVHPAAFGEWMAKFVRGYLNLMKATGRQPDLDLLAPLVEAGFLEIESENSASPDEVSPDPEEESR
jgi:tetratricopeptide (TPR) repeat protein